MSRYRLPGPFIALLGLFALTAAPAPAQTPLDTLVMAKDIGDIITFDPGESFELTAGEILANVYDRIMTFEPEDPGTLTGGVAESHTVSDDGRTITLRIRDGLTFHSGNPVRPEDVEFSLERVVRRGGSPAFILTQLGWNADNVGELVEAVDERHVRINIVEEFSPGLVLHALSAGIGSVVDRELVMAHEQDGDLGAAWLQTKSAGSGPFRLRSWQANESVVLDANPHYRHGAPGVRRVILRHVPEPSSQRLLLERGDVDIARDLTRDLIEALDGDEEIAVDSHPRGTLIYLATNQGHPVLGKPQAAGGAGAAPRGRLPRHGGLVSGRSVYRASSVLAARPVGGPHRDAVPTRRCAGEGATRAGGPRRRVRIAHRHPHQPAVSGHRTGAQGDLRRGRH